MNDVQEVEKFDIFISYTHEDNSGTGSSAWVSEFKNDLSLRIMQRQGQGRPLSIYIDKSQTGVGGTLPELIDSVLKNSQYLLPIVTPLYNESDWCELERVTFIEHHGFDEAMKRLVRVDKEPVDDVAGELEDLKQYRFYYRDKVGQIDHVLTKEGQKTKYDHMITELALHILHKVNEVNSSRDNTIYVARTSKNLKDKRSQISMQLKQRGFNIVPASLGVVASKAQEKARNNLENSFMSIHLIDSEFEPLLQGKTPAIDRIQFEEATKVDRLKTFVWTPSDDFSDPIQQELLEQVQQTNLTDLLHDFHELKEEVTAAAKEHQQNLERRTVTELSTQNKTINVYLQYGAEDEGAEDIKAIASALTKSGLEVFEPNFNEDDPHLHRSDCSAILYYFGAEPCGDLYYKIKTGTDLNHECIARCICLKHGTRLHNPTTKAIIIEAHEMESFNKDVLTPFFDAIGLQAR
jgi:hypothetical protein